MQTCLVIRPRNALVALVGVLAVVLGGVIGAPTTVSAVGWKLDGRVELDGRGLGGADVVVREVTSTGSRDVARTRSDARGRFHLRNITAPTGPLYVEATHARRSSRDLALVAALGTSPPTRVRVNELTTVAAGFALAQFTNQGQVSGLAADVNRAMGMAATIASVRTGRMTRFMRTEPNGLRTQTLRSINSLANAVSKCRRDLACRDFVDVATPRSGARSTNTFQALADIARHPAQQVRRIFELSRGGPYAPALRRAPSAWVLGLVFVGDGKQFNGPGNFIFDEDGDLWITNNYIPAAIDKAVCGARTLLELKPFGGNPEVIAYTGGGLDGAGFGITRDARDHVWVSNYGFKGTKCPIDPGSNTLSAFTLDGSPISPAGGFTQGGVAGVRDVMALSWPQGMGSGRDGSVWVANCGNDSVTRYADGDPQRSINTGASIPKPFGLVVDREGTAWVTSIGSDTVRAIRPDGRETVASPYRDESLRRPLGIAIDSSDAKWVSNSVVIELPCGQDEDDTRFGAVQRLETLVERPTVTRIGPDGRTQGFRGGGMTIPWGIAVDGDDVVWVADFGGSRVSAFCGAERGCGRGVRFGEPLFSDGLAFDGLQRNTGVQADRTGTLWLTNNWKQIPVQADPGGNGMVALVGVAAPVSDYAGVASGAGRGDPRAG